MMDDKKDPATLVAEAWDNLLAGINETPPFSWACALADWAVDKLAALLERITHKEDNMGVLGELEGSHYNPEKEVMDAAEAAAKAGIPADIAAENLRRNLEAMNGPSLPEQVREEFHKVFTERVRRPGAEDLLEWMERNGFFEAPASTKYHLAIPGGLALHSLNVYNRLREIAASKAILDAATEESVAIMALLHDLCKTDCYHRDGEGYKFRDPIPLGHGEKSVYIITKYMKLLETEALAIRWHMGAYDDAVKGGTKAFNAAMNLTPWVWRLHQADMIATWEDERSGDNGRA